ncbi:MAG TPA: sugar kinase [Sphingobium sp.]|jgi:2-dehydro-3-deoxygluconokinase|uniref:sugar kinase n=1 Tax=unclassified Sphingobium TaxID=2611147 RepID=UPI0007F37CAC|nr:MULTISPECIES: sugar kinase [unclassified Sphingobium]OAN56290.1 2-dehydro-3-deoxygluconokinase [Sphingobium sp. TCM1]WIW89846.1 sugar kinase [Sphingobium sp. V4]HAF40563.1 sugar kinase [Sphingobium sp.]
MGAGATITVIGEAMLELSRGQGDSWNLRYGGDVINTAVHLARSGDTVRLASALGADAMSADLRAQWEAEGVDTGLVLAAADRLPGLYAIETDATGERTFHYWRSEAAARRMFALPDSEAMVEAAAQSDLLYFSLITLAILPDEGREALLALCAAVKARGGKVAFDGNYRARLWPDATTACHWRDRAIALADIGLPTLADEVEMGEVDDARDAAARWGAGEGREIIVKLGGEGCLVGDQLVAPPRRIDVVDSSGAGDAFNAGYLHARLAGAAPVEAALAGHRLAGWNIGRRGAIPARDADSPY